MLRFDAAPGPQLKPAKVRYHQVDGNLLTIGHVVSKTPPPPGSTSFHSVEVVHAGGAVAERLRCAPRIDATYPVRFHELPETGCSPAREFAAIFEVLEGMMLAKANRQSLVLWVGRPDKPELDGFAGFLGMLPFRGISVALVSANAVRYPDPFSYRTPSGVLEHDANDPARMGKCCVSAMFGPLPARSFTARLREWAPIDVQPPAGCTELLRLHFKIAGLPLPMITYAGEYEKGVAALAERIAAAYSAGSLCPIVSCGEVVDRLGYGLDVLAALRERGHAGHYFTHKSGETSKRWAEYGKPELLGWVAQAKAAGQTPLFIAVGGGCNGNATGVVAAMTGAAFVEVPTTPLHYNDATTSAKKAFSLVIDGKIRAKNLLGTFYLPRLVWCINETFLTSSTASVHSTVGECTKTMNMLADPSSAAGRADYANILGANEFASDTTRILACIDGFEALVHFIEDASTREAKAAVLRLGEAVAEARAAAQCGTETARAAYASLCEGRRQLLQRFRARFYELPTAARVAIDAFLTVSNKEIVGAKAMFLAYEDPFEKYRALLFEYAHTLGHAVEAWLAGAIDTARASGVAADIVEAAVRNHGQCVGMAVVWAGAIAAELGALEGDGYVCHQGMVYLFNSFGGFSFAPVRALCDALGVSKPDFLREVLAGVRLDNKRGYCECGDDASVDQLVTHRPGRMLGSEDPNAEATLVF
mmetsp:Transcript_5361/g.17244  ORF Transcript_5361/g.17244 Transcript_5361/m.17244 type:complete len:705 (+) Transcript_5361:32-2146(+)